MATNLSQIRCVWTGWNGAPGYTNFYIDSIDPTACQDMATAAHTFFDAIKGQLPTSVRVNFPTDVRQVDGATGDLGAVVTLGTPPAEVVGLGTADFNAAAGASVTWLTVTPAASRLVTGRTYLVPMGGNFYESNGTPITAGLTVVRNAAAALVAAMDPIFCVWRRPVSGAGGSVAPIVGSRVNDIGVVLKSRRD